MGSPTNHHASVQFYQQQWDKLTSSQPEGLLCSRCGCPSWRIEPTDEPISSGSTLAIACDQCGDTIYLTAGVLGSPYR